MEGGRDSVGPAVPLDWWQPYVDGPHERPSIAREVRRIDLICRLLLREGEEHIELISQVLGTLKFEIRPPHSYEISNVYRFLNQFAYRRIPGGYVPPHERP